MIKSTKEILLDAKKNKYGVPAFNIDNYESLKGCIDAAEELNSPIIIEAVESVFECNGYENFVTLCLNMIKKASVPIALHWDHGFDSEKVIWGIHNGLQSVMIDKSTLSFSENVSFTKEIVDEAKKYNVNVEAEIGHVGGENENDHSTTEINYTSVEEAVKFVEETQIDFLAISVGTKHGTSSNKGEINLNIDRVKEIAIALPDTILVLHGTSGTPENQIKDAIAAGISKINYGNGLKDNLYQEITKFIEQHNYVLDWNELNTMAIQIVKENAKKAILMFGSNNQSKNFN